MSRKTTPEPYKIKIKYSFLEIWDEYKGKIERDIKILKRYTPKGQPVYLKILRILKNIQYLRRQAIIKTERYIIVKRKL